MITYYNKRLNIVLWRSSEPEQITISKRSIDDEAYLLLINPATDEYQKFFIFSCYEKDQKNVPHESEQYYKGVKVVNYGFN